MSDSLKATRRSARDGDGGAGQSRLDVEVIKQYPGGQQRPSPRGQHPAAAHHSPLHYNWKYIFLRSTIDQVVKRYVRKFGKSTMASFATSADGPSTVPPTPPPAADAAASQVSVVVICFALQTVVFQFNSRI